ncbi:MAG TPA: sterol carrier family protein [Propionicimonas sp.]|nr:sterol carrier family protein [Propionicimonas sp.]
MAKKVTAADLQQLRSTVAAVSAADSDVPSAALAAASRTVCALLAAAFPGGSVELRVPPFAAVQLGIGERGRHTRGTPPNVVQTDALTLLLLASGQLSWVDARDAQRVQASGPHSDLGALWPVPELT